MKQKFLTLLLVTAGLIPVADTRAQCTSYYWGGITFASAEPSWGLHPNTIYISWPASLTVEKYTVLYQDITVAGAWTTAAANFSNWYYYLSINPAHNYNVAVTVTCPDGTSKTDVRYQIAGETFSQVGNCLGVWSGLTTYTPNGTSLTVRWTDAVVDHYEVWTKLVDFFANPAPEWVLEGSNISSLSYTINNLEAKESYYVKIVAICRDGTRIEREHQFSIYIDGFTTPRCDEPGGLYEVTSATSAQLFAVMYTYLLGVNIDYYVTYSEASSGVYTTVQWTFPGLNQPNGVAIAKTISGLKPNTLYTWYITMVCNGFGQNTGYSFSASSKFFTKPLPPGPCNSTQGNYTAPAINNTPGTNFYSGTITSASAVTLSTVQHKFTATAVLLNPGFVTTVSGTGNFIANSFNPANCIVTKNSGNETGVEPDTLTGDLITGNTKEKLAPESDIAKQENKINLYPNPTTGLFTIQTKYAGEVIHRITITDASGRLVFTNSTNRRSFDISPLVGGIYFYQLETNKQTYTGKIIKQ